MWGKTVCATFRSPLYLKEESYLHNIATVKVHMNYMVGEEY